MAVYFHDPLHSARIRTETSLREKMFIPYTWLSESRQGVIMFGDVPVYFNLPEKGGRTCLISLSDAHRFQGNQPVTVSVPVGTAFEMEYRGTICEIQLGRRLILCDAA